MKLMLTDSQLINTAIGAGTLDASGLDFITEQDKLLAKAEQKKERLYNKDRLMEMFQNEAFDDGDSSEHFRVAGIDTPETWHAADLHNERTKAIKQYKYLHPELDSLSATTEAEQQMDAYKIAKDAGYNLADQISTHREKGDIDSSFDPTIFDIFKTGETSAQWAQDDNIQNPETGIGASSKFITGDTGHFGRYLSDNKEYAGRAISGGYAIPGSTDHKERADQLLKYSAAKESGKGNFSTETGKKVMDAIFNTSYATNKSLGKKDYSTGAMLHYESPENFQHTVGSKLQYQVYRDESNPELFYEYATDSGGNFITDQTGQLVKTQVDPKDVEAVYIGEGKQNIDGKRILKLGIATANLKPEFVEMYKEQGPEFVARYVDKRGVNPYKHDYRPRKGEINPLTGEAAKGYDGTPGPYGVDVDKGALMNVLMRKGAAEDLEKYVHTHAGQIEERAAGSGPLLTKDAYNKYDKMFKAGTSEYTTEDAPLWNIDYNMAETDSISDEVKAEPMPSKGRDWNKILTAFDKDKNVKPILDQIVKGNNPYRADSSISAPGDNRSVLEKIADMPEHLIAGAATRVLDETDATAELATNITARGFRALGFEDIGNKIDSVDIGTADEKQEMVHDVVGQDNRYTKYHMDKIEKLYDDAVKDVKFTDIGSWSNVKLGSVGEALGHAFANTDTTAHSVGWVMGSAYGVVASLGRKALKGTLGDYVDEVAEINAKNLGKDETKKAIGDVTKKLSTSDRTKLFIMDNANALSMSASMNSDQLDEVIERNGGEVPTITRAVLGTAANFAGAKFEIGSTNFALKGAKTAVSEALGDMGKAKATKFMTNLLSNTAKLGVAGLGETVQETTQTFIEEFNKVYGTDIKDSSGEVISEVTAAQAAGEETRKQAAIGGLAGGPAGAHMAMPKVAYNTIKGAYTAIKGDEELTPEQKELIKKDTVTESVDVQYAQPKADGTYAFTEAMDELNQLHENETVELDAVDSIEDAVANPLAVRKSKLGTRLKLKNQKLNAANKVVNSDGTDEDKKAMSTVVTKLQGEVDELKSAMHKILNEQVEELSDEEFNSLSDDELAEVFYSDGDVEGFDLDAIIDSVGDSYKDVDVILPPGYTSTDEDRSLDTDGDFGLSTPQDEDFGLSVPDDQRSAGTESKDGTESSAKSIDDVYKKLERVEKILKAGYKRGLSSKKSLNKVAKAKKDAKTIQSVSDNILYDDKGILTEILSQSKLKQTLNEARQEYVKSGLINSDYDGKLSEVYNTLSDDNKVIANQISKNVQQGRPGWSIPNIERRLGSINDKHSQIKEVSSKRGKALVKHEAKLRLALRKNAEILKKNGYESIDDNNEIITVAFKDLGAVYDYMLDEREFGDSLPPKQVPGFKGTEINYTDVVKKLKDKEYNGGIYSIIEASKGEIEALNAVKVNDKGELELSPEYQKKAQTKKDKFDAEQAEKKAKDEKTEAEAAQAASGEQGEAKTATDLTRMQDEIVELEKEAQLITDNLDSLKTLEETAIAKADNLIANAERTVRLHDDVAKIWNTHTNELENLSTKKIALSNEVKNLTKELNAANAEKEALLAEVNAIEGSLTESEIDRLSTMTNAELDNYFDSIRHTTSDLVRGTKGRIKRVLRLIKTLKTLESTLTEKGKDLSKTEKSLKEVGKERKSSYDKALAEKGIVSSYDEDYKDPHKAAKAQKRRIKNTLKTHKDVILSTPSAIVEGTADWTKDLRRVPRLLKLQEMAKTQSGNRLSMVRKKIKDLQNSLTTPHTANAILTSQASKHKPGTTTSSTIGKGTKNERSVQIPNNLNAYTKPKRIGSSLFSVLPFSQLNSTGLLNKYLSKGKKFLDETNINPVGEQFRPLDAPFEELIYNTDGDLNNTVVSAIAIVSENLLLTQGSGLQFKTTDDVSRMFPGVPMSAKLYNEFKNLNNRNHLGNTAGQLFMDTIGLTENTEGGQESYARLRANAGTYVLKYMEHQGWLDPIEADNSATVNTKGYKGTTYTAKRIAELKGMPEEDIVAAAEDTVTVQYVKVPSKLKNIASVIKSLKSDIDEVNDHLGMDQAMRTAKNSKPTAKTPEDYSVHDTIVPNTEMVNSLNALMQEEQGLLIAPMAELMKMTREEALTAMGVVYTGTYKNADGIEVESIPRYDVREAQKAINKEREREYDAVVDLYNAIEEGTVENGIWFPYKSSTAGRQYITTVLLDNQTNKELQRWLITPKSAKQSYNKKIINNILAAKTYNDVSVLGKTQYGFIQAVIQAFGGDVDKDSHKDKVKLAKTLMAMSQDELMDRIKNGDIAHLGHAHQVRSAINDYQNSESSFDTTIIAEYDGVTDGVIRKLLQFPLGEEVLSLLTKGGFLTVPGLAKNILDNGKKPNIEEATTLAEKLIGEKTPMNELIAAGFILDIYKTQAKLTDLSEKTVQSKFDVLTGKGKDYYKDPLELGKKGVIAKHLPATWENAILEDEKGNSKLLKELREMFKDPTMVTQYGAKIKNAIKATARGIVDRQLNKEIEAELKTKGSSTFLKSIADKTHKGSVTALLKDLSAKSISEIKVGKTMTLDEALISTYETAISEQMEKTLMAVLGPVITVTDDINETTRAMFDVYEEKFTADLEKAVKEHGVDGVDSLPKSKITELVQKNKKYLPLIKGPGSKIKNSDGTYEDGIIIADSELASSDNNVFDNSKTKMSEVSDGKVKSIQPRAFVRVLKASYAGAGVLPTQNEDGKNMAVTISEFISELGIQGVHDAILAPGKDASKVLRFYTTETINISKNYSQLDAILDAAVRAVAAAEKDGIDTAKLKDAVIPLLAVADDVLISQVNLWNNNDMLVEHMPGHDASVVHNAKGKVNQKELKAKVKSHLGSMVARAEILTGSTVDKKEIESIRSAITSIKDLATQLDMVKEFSSLITGEDC
jgi:hypothetical protein